MNNNESCYLNPDRDYLLRHVQLNKTMVRGEGVYLYDEDGHQYLDFLAQYGAVPFGHNPEQAWDALCAGRGEPSMVQPFYTRAAKSLAQELVSLEPEFNFSYAVLSNSGAESVEAALKLARAATGREVIISLCLGFHGKTSGALTVTGNPVYSEPFLVSTAQSVKVEPEDFEQLERAFAEHEVAGFIFETVLGEGGMQPLSAEYIQHAAALCKRHGAMLIADEIQTGLGRLGEFFSIKRVPGVRPDIMCLSKALGGGLVPIGATLCTKGAWSEAFGMYHSSTFANNQVACRVALSTLARLKENDRALMRHVDSISAYLDQALETLVGQYPDVFSQHQGTGLMHSLRLKPFCGAESYFLAHASIQGYLVPLICGYLVNVARIIVAPLFNRQDLLRIEPSLIIEREHIDRLITALSECALLIRNKQFSSLFAYVVGRQPEEISYSCKPPVALPMEALREPNVGGDPERLGSFAFLIHPTSAEDLLNIMPRSIIDLNESHKLEFQQWMASWFSRRYEPAPVFHAPRIKSKLGGYVEGWLIACPLPPERMIRLPKQQRMKLLKQYVEAAKSVNADIIGLGAFTSIISRGGMDIVGEGIPITTGNSFTAIASAESLHKALVTTGKQSGDSRIAIVGAAGSVGRLAAIHLATYYASLILVGNSANAQALDQLGEIAGEIYAQALVQMQQHSTSGLANYLREHLLDRQTVMARCNQMLLSDGAPDYRAVRQLIESHLPGAAPIEISVSIEYAMRNAHGVLSATSAGHSFIEPAWLRQSAVVCDAARPPDLKDSVREERPDVVVFEGGVVRFVEPYRFGRANILGFCPTLNLACLSETVALSMSGVKQSYSLGNRIPYDQALRIYRLALSHGFSDCIATTEGELDLRVHHLETEGALL
ncbi:aminotransferase class III-fold pyridoxal phosphate-dependent enzyme [Jeongeupia naejangsanensis]|uniref:Aminotransferase class III-fold pyridoxal phosphate-dependent enzyme n=1 Tax=Jeongeupia naejangsanensis TaxID=613195 RepID=A0ABS2BN50_9NEIS|nr:aminotransferase class III-fold pyridoxal phosphate-dependent enzyme [Jeongeupia naejangsanensis]MBM3117041.1 aminotransferase class III-fold pyridoxal phosphate-dependent enzyme [Jeongeupia naejangsanensis]